MNETGVSNDFAVSPPISESHGGYASAPYYELPDTQSSVSVSSPMPAIAQSYVQAVHTEVVPYTAENMIQFCSKTFLDVNGQMFKNMAEWMEKGVKQSALEKEEMAKKVALEKEEMAKKVALEKEELIKQTIALELAKKESEMQRTLLEEKHKSERLAWEHERRLERLQTENSELVAKCARLSEANAVPSAAVRVLAVAANNLSEPVAEAVQPEQPTSVQIESGSAAIEAGPLLTAALVSVPVQQITISEERILEIMQMKKIPRNSLAEKVFRLDLNMDEFTQFLRATGKCAETLQIYDKKRGRLNFFSYKGDRLDPVKFNAFTDSIGGEKAFRINQYHEAFANQTRYVAILPDKVVSERDMLDVLKAWSSCQPIFKCDPVKFGRVANEGTNAQIEAINQLNSAFAANKVYMWTIFDNLGSSNGAIGSG
jgi:hypothetical protein